MPKSDEQTRIEILQFLYDYSSQNPEGVGVDRAIIQATLNIPAIQMDNNLEFLADQGFVTLSGIVGSKWTFAKITGEGINVVENRGKYPEKPAFAATARSSQAVAEPREKISKINQPKLAFSQLIAAAFSQASERVAIAQMPSGGKDKIDKQLKSLEKELSKGRHVDFGSVQKQWMWLKKNADWVCPIVAPAVLEAVKQALDIQDSVS